MEPAHVCSDIRSDTQIKLSIYKETEQKNSTKPKTKTY